MEKIKIASKIMSGALALFAKTASLSPVKTRLAADIGRAAAETFYALSVAAVAEVVDNTCRRCAGELVPYWALAEVESLEYPQWQNFTTLWTGPGDLGQRLDSVYRRLLDKHEFVILMGTDSPQLTPELLLSAIDKIKQNPQRCLVGPASDGGFYLFAGCDLLPVEVWTKVVYSHTQTLTQLCNNLLAQNINIERLVVCGDIDNVTDFRPLAETLRKIPDRSCVQQKLYEWLTRQIL
jgi:glycosyltransferase A (GT-A) superfamily protein (DUF2064 family)